MRKIALIAALLPLLLVFTACSSEEPFTPENIVKKGGVVSYGINEKADNLVKLIAFIDKAQNGQKANIRIANFWGEKTFIDDVNYNGKVFKWIHRSTPSDKGKTTICKGLDVNGAGIVYLTDCNGKQKGAGVIAAQKYFYDKAVQEYKKQQQD